MLTNFKSSVLCKWYGQSYKALRKWGIGSREYNLFSVNKFGGKWKTGRKEILSMYILNIKDSY